MSNASKPTNASPLGPSSRRVAPTQQQRGGTAQGSPKTTPPTIAQTNTSLSSPAKGLPVPADEHIGDESFFKSRFDTESFLPLAGGTASGVVSAISHTRGEEADDMDDKVTYGLEQFLRTVPHFFCLPHDLMQQVGQEIVRREYRADEVILRQREPVDNVYIVLRGGVEVFSCDAEGHRLRREGVLNTGGQFGFDHVILRENSPFTFVATSKSTTSMLRGLTIVGLLPGAKFLQLIKESVSFAQSIGRKMAEHMDVFRAMKDFVRSIFSLEATTSEYLNLPSILESYAKLDNCIHTKCNTADVDTSAWLYAIRRLPDNITSTFCFDLSRSLPPFVAARMREVTKLVEVKSATPTPAPTAASAASVTTARQHSFRNVRRGSAAVGTSSDIVFVPTNQRRRCCWELGVKGKTLVLLRDGFTDMLDFITCLCVHIYEAKTLRARLQGMVHPPAIDILDDVLANVPLGYGDEDPIMQRMVLEKMPLTPSEREGLVAIWPKTVLRRIYDVIMHREEFMLRMDSSMSRRFQADPFHEWALGIRNVVLQKLHLSPLSPLPDDMIVDVISSNTHSTKNCLSPFARRFRSEILDFGRRNKPQLMALQWNNEEDLVYVLVPSYLAANPGRQADHVQALRDCGIEIMEDTALTGLQVDIIPVWMLDVTMLDPALDISPMVRCRSVTPSQGSNKARVESIARGDVGEFVAPVAVRPASELSSPSTVDGSERTDAFNDSAKVPVAERGVAAKSPPTSPTLPTMPPKVSPTPAGFGTSQADASYHFIVNMDFAFGAQAEGILRALVMTFGHRIRSVNVMGKAGGLVGQRGDIQLATHVLFSKSSLVTEDPLDELRPCGNSDLSRGRLEELAGPDRTVHVGPVLTIPGTMLQNEKLLRYYLTIWQCVGVEMEGSYFARQIREAQKAGLISKELLTRFAYYVSDLPLEVSADTNLSVGMRPNEGTPPLYTITRAFLERMLR